MSKSRKPTISVIIPAYNAEKWVSETIKSVQQQTFSDWEIIVIDDGSSDGTLETLRGIVDERLKVFPYEHGGVSVARNRGLAYSSGEFIAFLDADDLWTPDMLELHLAALQKHPEADVAYCWFYMIDEDGNFLSAYPQVFWEGNVFPQLLDKIFIACGSIVIRQQAIESVGGFDPRLRHFEDWDYWLRLALHSRFVLVPKYQLLYRRWPGSTTFKSNWISSEESLKCRIIVIEKAVQLAPQSFKTRCLVHLNLLVAYNYMERYLHCQSDADGVKRAGQRMGQAIRLEPKILLEVRTLRPLVKWLLLRTLPPRLSSYFLKLYRRIRDGIKSQN